MAVCIAVVLGGLPHAQAAAMDKAKAYHFASMGLIVRPSHGWTYLSPMSEGGIFRGPDLVDDNDNPLGRTDCLFGWMNVGTSVTTWYARQRMGILGAGHTMIKRATLLVLKQKVAMYVLVGSPTIEGTGGYFRLPHHKGVALIGCNMPRATGNMSASKREVKDATAAWKAFASSISPD